MGGGGGRAPMPRDLGRSIVLTFGIMFMLAGWFMAVPPPPALPPDLFYKY